MFKAIRGLFILLLSGAALQVAAQTTDSLKKTDTLKIDTNELNQYRIEPGKNALPFRFRPVQIHRREIPVTMLDYEVSYWHKNILFGLNFSQAAFSSNYAAGGISSIALGSNFDYKVEYNKSPLDFTSELNLVYGISKNKDQGSRKTNDRIFWDNKLATQLSKHWFFFGSLTFESQFDKGYSYTTDSVGNSIPHLISNFMSPGYLTESVGFEFKPSKFFDLRLGTGTARQTFVLDTTIYHNQPTNYGVPIGKRIYNELAFQVVAVFDKDLSKTTHLNARYAMFVPYQQGLQYTSHRVDAVFTSKVTKLIAFTVNGTFLYDKNTSDKIQGTEGLALGIVYKFP
ncbi:MAG TPA: DUF3078 domain-containing protein [Mucilaginibacter sp.]|nr:DUF3078 domain-containing protein [Mucilaginibacter sp.]